MTYKSTLKYVDAPVFLMHVILTSFKKKLHCSVCKYKKKLLERARFLQSIFHTFGADRDKTAGGCVYREGGQHGRQYNPKPDRKTAQRPLLEECK